MTSKAVERALTLLGFLSARPYGVEREEIRWHVPGYRMLATLSAFERAFERDKQVLRALGISLVAQREPTAESGVLYRIDQRVSASHIDFSSIDIVVLHRCVRAWDGTELERLARSALLKVGTFTGYRGDGGSEECARFTVSPGLAECVASLAEGKGISCVYGQGASVRKIFCWGLGVRYGHWYVVGWDVTRQQQRIYRLDRMSDIKVLALEGPAPPPGFSMADVLEQLSAAATPNTLTVALRKDFRECSHQGKAQISPSFGILESARSAIAQGRTHALDANQVNLHKVDIRYQATVAQAENTLRRELLIWHQNTPEIIPPVPGKEWKILTSQRSRESASEQLLRLLLMVYLVSESGGMYLSEVADFFNMPEKRVRLEIENLADIMGHNSLEVEITSDGFITVWGNSTVATGVALTDAEYIVLGLALDLADSSEPNGIYSLLKFKLWSAASRFDDGIGAAPLSERVAVYRADIDTELAYALEHRVPLDISYRSYRGVSSRTIEPVKLVIDNGPKYVRAWCRRANAYRNFSLASILESRLLLGQVYEHQLEDDGVSPHQWLREVVTREHSGEPFILALPADLPLEKREKVTAVLSQYAREMARGTAWVFYRVSVVYYSWFFDLMVELGPSVFIVSPEKMRERLIAHVESGHRDLGESG